MGRYGFKAIWIVVLIVLSGCDKSYTPADFMKDESLRSRVLAQCTQQGDNQLKNCQNALEAQKKIDFEKKTGKTEIN